MTLTPDRDEVFDVQDPFIGSTEYRIEVDDWRNAYTPLAGDVCVTKRRNRFRFGMWLFGDPVTHGVMIVGDGDDARTLELGPVGIFSRPFRQLFTDYELVAVSRTDLHPECRQAVVEEALRQEAAGNARYSFPLCVVVGLANFARRVLPNRMAPQVEAVAQGIARRWPRRWLRPRRAASCSGFVAECFRAACPDCLPQAEWPMRAPLQPFIAAPGICDVQRAPNAMSTPQPEYVALSLLSPTDLWVWVPSTYRVVFHTPVGDTPERTVLMLDARPEPLTDARGGAW